MWPGNETQGNIAADKDTSNMAIIARQASREKTDEFMSMGETEVIGQYGCMLMRTLIKRRKCRGSPLVRVAVRTSWSSSESTLLSGPARRWNIARICARRGSCMCVCVRERERERERGSHDEQEVQRARPNVVQLTELTRSCFRYLFPAEACNRWGIV